MSITEHARRPLYDRLEPALGTKEATALMVNSTITTPAIALSASI